MMEPFERIDIQELPLSVLTYYRKVSDFLGRNGLRLEEVDLYLAVLDADGRILAGGGLYRDIIKCIAVSYEARAKGYAAPLVSRLISAAAERGFTSLKVFTKPGNRSVFESLGFHVLAEAPKAILMENGRGLEEYCAYLRKHRAEGVIVMNANPFTLGHKYLVEQASSAVSGRLAIIPVKADRSEFTYGERVAMMRAGCGGLAEVVEGSDYQISEATFPTYFLKDLSDASEAQMRLDIDLFGRHIAPALGVSRRFVGSEPLDELTARYNQLMCELLPSYGVEVTVLERFRIDGEPVRASRVRGALDAASYRSAMALTPETTHPYLAASLAARALKIEALLAPKPGLVDGVDPGAHLDMDYSTLLCSIDAIRPFFSRMGQASTAGELRQLGIDAEQAMLAATGGVNTHRGAIFAIGLALAAVGRLGASACQGLGVDDRRMEVADSEKVMQNRLVEIARAIFDNSLIDKALHSTRKSHGVEAVEKYGVRGAKQMALEGYPELFSSWLPFFRQVNHTQYGLQKTLLLIMSTLDDTCVIHRVGFDRAQEVKKEAADLLAGFSRQGLEEMNLRYKAEGISPGGAADMLALTILTDSLTTYTSTF